MVSKSALIEDNVRFYTLQTDLAIFQITLSVTSLGSFLNCSFNLCSRS